MWLVALPELLPQPGVSALEGYLDAIDECPFHTRHDLQRVPIGHNQIGPLPNIDAAHLTFEPKNLRSIYGDGLQCLVLRPSASAPLGQAPFPAR